MNWFPEILIRHSLFHLRGGQSFKFIGMKENVNLYKNRVYLPQEGFGKPT